MEEPQAAVRISRSDAFGYIARSAFSPGISGRVGIELELFVLDAADATRIPSPDELRDVLGAGPPGSWVDPRHELPGGSRLTFEPGGQLELSGPPALGGAAAIAALEADVAAVRQRLTAAGLNVRGGGLESAREPYRWVRGRRYDAMAAHFRACGPQSQAAGAVMMTATAALQINLDAGGDEATARARWNRAHVVAPVLAAMFAASPVLSGRRLGAASGRLEAWHALDPCRTRPVPDVAPDRDPRAQWAQYALNASVFLVSDPVGGHPAASGFSLGEWVSDPELAGRPVTTRDIDEHLTTLFPPIRPRGFLELRYLDGQHIDDWPVAVAVVAAVHDDPRAAVAAAEACVAVSCRWVEAARDALGDPELAVAAAAVMDIALTSLSRRGEPSALIDRVEDFADRYVRRGRCPADDAIDLVVDASEPAAGTSNVSLASA